MHTTITLTTPPAGQRAGMRWAVGEYWTCEEETKATQTPDIIKPLFYKAKQEKILSCIKKKFKKKKISGGKKNN